MQCLVLKPKKCSVLNFSLYFYSSSKCHSFLHLGIFPIKGVVEKKYIDKENHICLITLAFTCELFLMQE